MKTAPVYEAQNCFSELLAAAEQGEVISITRRGIAVARLVAEPSAKTGKAEAKRRIAASFARLQALRSSLQLAGDLKAISRDGAD